MINLVSFTNNIFKTLSISAKTVTVSAHSKEKEWGLPLVRLGGQGKSERDIYDISQTEKTLKEIQNAQ